MYSWELCLLEFEVSQMGAGGLIRSLQWENGTELEVSPTRFGKLQQIVSTDMFRNDDPLYHKVVVCL